MAAGNNYVADSGQWHLATNHQDDLLSSSSLSINIQAQDPVNDLLLNARNDHTIGADFLALHMQHLDRNSISPHPAFGYRSSQVYGNYYGIVQQQRTGESHFDTLTPGLNDIGNISVLLNHDQNTSAPTFVVPQASIQDSGGFYTEPAYSSAGIKKFIF